MIAATVAPTQVVEPHGAKARIGLVALSTDLAVEGDFHRLAAASDGDVAVFTTRIPLVTPNTVESFLALERELPGVVERLIPDSHLHAVVFGCTSASMIIGAERVNATLAQGRPGLVATNPASAAAAALQALGARRIAMVTPYTAEITQRAVDWFETHAGLSVTTALGFGRDRDDDHARIAPQAWIDAAQALDLTDVDAVFLSCTATRALDAIAPLEARIERPVVTSNQAAFWHAARLAGFRGTTRGYGKLLSGFEVAERWYESES